MIQLLHCLSTTCKICHYFFLPIFYMRQLWVFIFCLHSIKNDRAKFCIYYEGLRKKFPNELPPTVKNLILFSALCGGQNKNHTLSRFLRNSSDNSLRKHHALFSNQGLFIFTLRSRLRKHKKVDPSI